MKTLILFLIFSTIGYCLADTEIVDCESDFEIKVKEKCEAIGRPCTFNSKTKKCFETYECSQAVEGKCQFPKNFTFYKCVPSGTGTNFECNKKPRTCSEFNSIVTSATISGDIICPQLSSSISGKHCLLNNYGNCNEDNYEQCSSLTIENDCKNNIPKDLSTKCNWNRNPSDPTHPFCEPIPRNCGDSFYNENIDNCGRLAVSDNNKKCIFIRTSGICDAHFIRCEDIVLGSGEECDDHKPLNQKQNGYNYTTKCVPDDSSTSVKKCKTEKKKCRDYYFANLTESIPTFLQNILSDLSLQGIKFDETFCSQLDVSEDYYRCAFNEIHGCYEEFNTCEDYTKIVETDRACEDIVLLTQNQKCFYNNINDTCITRQIYHSCDEYKEGDKKTCESILSSENNKYCILDKDSECIEKPINCSEAYTKEDCLHIAKPSDSNKRCVWGDKDSYAPIDPYSSIGICYEEFLRCEDYIEKSEYGSNKCEYIKLYDGKICKPETLGDIGRCISQFKTCENATTEEECKLISKTGVADLERKVCDWYTSTGRCIENYKYCSDYRGNEGDKCTRIKPYDASGNNIDIGFKCSNDEEGVGCQKVPLECEDAKNPVECTSFSDYIKDKEKQYCVYYGDKCTTQYKQCEDVDPYSSSCSTNIIEGYIINACSQTSDGKCERKNDQCSNFIGPKNYNPNNPDSWNSMDKYYIDLCQSINPNCTYTKDGKCKFKKKNCSNTIFYSNETDKNKLICENIQVEKPYKKCVLKKDFSGCEEVYIEADYSTANTSYSTSPDASSQGNSSGFIVKGIHLIIVLLCLLI